MAFTRSWPREGQSRFSLLFVFIGTQDGSAVCRHKSNQKGCQQKCFFAALGLRPANPAEPGLQLFCPTSFPQSTLQQKLAMPRNRTGHRCSARSRLKLLC